MLADLAEVRQCRDINGVDVVKLIATETEEDQDLILLLLQFPDDALVDRN